MSKATTLAVTLALAAIGSLPLSAHAARATQTCTDDPVMCVSEYLALEAATQAANFPGRRGATDKANLMGKIQESICKANLSKFADARQKLDDYLATTGKLATDGKLDMNDYSNSIYPAAIAAKGCLPQ